MGNVFTHAFQFAERVIVDSPMVTLVRQRVVRHRSRRKVRHKLLVHKLIQRKMITGLGASVEMFDKRNDPRIDL